MVVIYIFNAQIYWKMLMSDNYLVDVGASTKYQERVTFTNELTNLTCQEPCAPNALYYVQTHQVPLVCTPIVYLENNRARYLFSIC